MTYASINSYITKVFGRQAFSVVYDDGKELTASDLLEHLSDKAAEFITKQQFWQCGSTSPQSSLKTISSANNVLDTRPVSLAISFKSAVNSNDDELEEQQLIVESPKSELLNLVDNHSIASYETAPPSPTKAIEIVENSSLPQKITESNTEPEPLITEHNTESEHIQIEKAESNVIIKNNSV